jgi:hypothetical protein
MKSNKVVLPTRCRPTVVLGTSWRVAAAAIVRLPGSVCHLSLSILSLL